MTDAQIWNITPEQADTYESYFVPAIFAQWPDQVCDAVAIQSGEEVLDVGCGTGILARTVAGRVAPRGTVAAVDINDGMLRVARRLNPNILWRKSDAAELPFSDNMFDVVVSQFAFMFINEQAKAMAEIKRVLRPGGRIAIAVWAPLERSKPYVHLVESLERHAGAEAAQLLRSPFKLGDPDELREMFARAMLRSLKIHLKKGTAKYPSIDEFLAIEIKNTAINDLIDDDIFGRIEDDAHRLLEPFKTDSGELEIPLDANIAVATT
jgi:ubiquinone/menaquinone biosynthesis C-methylase UbiE